MLFDPMHHRHGAASLVRMFLLLLMLLPTLGWGQHYEISGQSSLTGVFTLTVYDGDSSTHTFTDKANKGMFFFSGNVEKPVLASIQHPTMSQPLFSTSKGRKSASMSTPHAPTPPSSRVHAPTASTVT